MDSLSKLNNIYLFSLKKKVKTKAEIMVKSTKTLKNFVPVQRVNKIRSYDPKAITAMVLPETQSQVHPIKNVKE